MNLKFEEFQQSNLGLKELDNIRLKSFKPEVYKSSILKKQLHENSCK